KEMYVEDVDLVMDIYGYIYNQDKRPIPNAKITVKDEDGTNERHLVSTESGKFTFKNLSEEKNYIFEANADDPSMHDVTRLYIADSKGRIYKVVELTAGKFAFKILEVDKTAMGEFLIEDPALRLTDKGKTDLATKDKDKGKDKDKDGGKTQVVKNDDKGKTNKDKPEVVKAETTKTVTPKEEEPEMTLTLIENIYYAYGDYKLGPDGEKILNKAIEVLSENPKLIMEISSHTDSQSSYGFNLGLSNRRAQTALNYLVAHGIAQSRLKAVGYGEMRLLNHCADNVPCGDDEHKVNRRTEFKITKPNKK
ncbi:MAG: OmpA family protein, partial [Bacteroidia bacterium]|nr:OmpA family protein [Bacteroidia bacterium]